MRKNVIAVPAMHTAQQGEIEWLNLGNLAHVEVTSESPDFPIESVFGFENGPGWRAAEPSQQLIRIVFDQPRSIHRIQLRFSEREVERTQEFTLRWSGSPGGDFREIVRQQWNFSPQGSTSEIEDYSVSLPGVSALELAITPDLRSNNAIASLSKWQVA
jgi:hypothetical protein